MNERMSTDIYRTAFEDCRRYKQDEAEPECLGNTVLQHFNYCFATNSWKELLRRSAMLFRWTLIIQETEHSSMGAQ